MEKRPIFALFTPSYWRAAVNELHNLRTLCLAALMVALVVVVELLFVPVGENLRIMFSFLLMALGGAIYGPLMSMAVGFAADIIGATVFPSGAFFFGYTLSAVCGGLIYGLFLYRTRITIVKLVLCKLCINLFVNVMLGSVWSSMLVGKGYLYYLFKSLVKNALLLPIEVFMLVLLFMALMPLLKSRGVTIQKKNKILDIW